MKIELSRLRANGQPIRDNEGNWFIREVESGEHFARIPFHGTAKRNRFEAPDPDGEYIAEQIVKLWNEREL